MSTQSYEQRLIEAEIEAEAIDREKAQVKALGDLAANSANLTNIAELLAVLPEIVVALGRIAAALERMTLPAPYPVADGRMDGLHDHDCAYYD